jgi:uncharacterized membrane protein YoaK (UPF0700 family)
MSAADKPSSAAGQADSILFNRAADRGVWWQDQRHGPLPLLLLVLAMVTGLVDAVSYLKLGHVFVANMTGNIVFLGFAIADAQDFSIAASLLATVAFLGGALAGGRLGLTAGHHRGRLLAISIGIEVVLVALTLVLTLLTGDPSGGFPTYSLIVLLALTMGLQTATARRLGVPDLPTTVLTVTLTALAADSTLAGAANTNAGRRLLAIIAMFLGATIGALLVFHVGVDAVFLFALAVLTLAGIAAYRYSSSSAGWTAGT